MGIEVDLDQKYAVVSVPANTVEMTITATVYLDGELKCVQTKYDMAAVREAIAEAEENYIPEDAVFTLTEKGRAIADLMDTGMCFDDACAAIEHGYKRA